MWLSFRHIKYFVVSCGYLDFCFFHIFSRQSTLFIEADVDFVGVLGRCVSRAAGLLWWGPKSCEENNYKHDFKGWALRQVS